MSEKPAEVIKHCSRRNFLQTVSASVPTLMLVGQVNPAAAEPDSGAAKSEGPDPPPGVNYFSRKKLGSLVDASLSLEGIPFQAVAFNFPNYHPSSTQERFFGKGWTEWELQKRAKPMFAGHLQPKRSLWGDFNEADPAWAEQEIETASRCGISAFAVDWYWYNGIQVLQEQLEQGFLKARNRHKLRFAIMWANISWRNQYPPPDSAAAYFATRFLGQKLKLKILCEKLLIISRCFSWYSTLPLLCPGRRHPQGAFPNQPRNPRSTAQDLAMGTTPGLGKPEKWGKS